MIKTDLLEVYTIEPRLKHATIFEYFDYLVEGESFIIKNDHDPKPLYYQLLGERGQIFTWDYLESGPEYWQVRIGKNLLEDIETIGGIAAKDVQKAELLKSLGVDFCCGGKQSVKEAAQSVGMTEELLRERLNSSQNVVNTTQKLEFASWDIAFLSDYIKNVHHQYVKDKGPIIQQLADKVAMVHGNQHPELMQLSLEFNSFVTELYQHLETEENQLFPAIKNMQKLTEKEIVDLIKHLSKEHEDSGREVSELRKITNNYTLPKNACNSYVSLFSQMKAFEDDLLQHIHLENNILFPKLIKAYQA